MLTTAQEVYTQTIRSLPPAERLKLANLILNDLVYHQSSLDIAQSDFWTEQDQDDLTSFSLQYAATLFDETEESKL